MISSIILNSDSVVQFTRMLVGARETILSTR